MPSFIQHSISNQSFLVSSSRFIFWEEEKTIILSDLHIGKSGHFRKNGIGIPQNMFQEDLHRLFTSVPYFKPQQFIFVGDLFHSAANKEHDLFLRWRSEYPRIAFHLVRGNHDAQVDVHYLDAGISSVSNLLRIGDFCFIHDPAHLPEEENRYAFTGHIHPGVLLGGKGKQSLRLPCFHFNKKQCCLPAFGKFTGIRLITPAKGDAVMAITDNEVIQVCGPESRTVS
ncbi:MAG: ligase-associated DNA damage response endonuclease PdeM [Sphingobacteriales bacterium]|nr:ligase-associated DNA damage response endonuclease PdeM [Sphingobacteriales bacterium]